MAAGFDFTRLKRLLTIQLVVQIVLVALLATFSLWFQAKLQDNFLQSVIVALVIQLGAFFPLRKLASLEVDREVGSAALGLTPADLQALRRRRMTADVIKTSVFFFFMVFIIMIPEKIPPSFLATVFFTFVLTIIAYLQCFNFQARREIRDRGGK